MINRLFSSVMIVTSAFTIIIGQTAPEAKQDQEKVSPALAFSFNGDGGFLGVQTQEISKENFGKFGLRDVRGVAVEKVVENSPAAAAGIREGDVIVRFNGDNVTSTRKLTRLIGEVDPDHQVKLTIARNGSEQEITATLGKRPAARLADGNFFNAAPNLLDRFDVEKFKNMPQLKDWPPTRGFDGPGVFTVPPGGGESFAWRLGEGRQIGISVYPVTKQLGERFGVEGGVMVNDVHIDSPAAKAGLRAGDIIVEIDGKAVKNNLDLLKSISNKKEGDVQVTIVRDRSRQTLNVTPEASKGGGFFYQTDDDGGFFRTPRPAMPSAPPVAPSPMRIPAPSRIAPPARVI